MNGVPKFGDASPGAPRVETKAYRFPAASPVSASVGDDRVDLAARLRQAEERARIAEQQLSIAVQALAAQQWQGAKLLQMLVESSVLAKDLQRDLDDLRRQNTECRIELIQKQAMIDELTLAGYSVETDRLERSLAEIRAKCEAAMTVQSDEDTKQVVVDVDDSSAHR